MSILPWKRRRERELDEEIRAHLAMATRDRVAAGQSPESAEFAARREFGNVALVKEVTRGTWGGMWLERLVQDVRYAVRSLSRVPGFTLAAILTLALGIGANTAIFSVVNGVILRPLDYPRPGQLVFISSQFLTQGFDQFPVDPAEFLELRERSQSFQSVGAYVADAVNLGTDGQPARVPAAAVSASLFSTLEVAPRLGRTFTERETLPGASPVAVLSDELWRSAFGARPSIVGEQVDVDGVRTTVIGVMPPRFDVHDQGVKIWLPLPLDPAKRQQYRGGHYLYLIGRLKPGVTLERARNELQTLLRQWAVTDGVSADAAPGQPGFVHTPNTTSHRLRYDDLQTDMVGGVRTALWVLQAAVLLVLLIACANMANLMLMRAESRHRELALRAALGAGRGRLLRQFIVEGLVLSLAGAVTGVLLARWGLGALVAANAGSIPRASSVTLDGTVLLFTLALALATGAAFGLAPLLHMSAHSVGLALREAGTRTTTGSARKHVRRGLVVAEMALAMMLVVGAGLLLRSFWNLVNVDAGFDRGQLTTFGLALPAESYDSARNAAFYGNLTRRLAALPGVRGAAAMSGLPPRRAVNANDTEIEGFVPRPGGPGQNVDYYQFVTPGYLETMGIPVVSGRSFRASDDAESPPVVMINETMARLFYPGQDPIGRRVRPVGAKDWFTIVGVVKDVKQGGVDSKTGTELYLDYAQMPGRLGYLPRSMNIVMRSSLGPSALAGGIRRTVGALDPSLPIVSLRSMDDVFADAVSRPRFLAQLLGIFATVALALAAVGTYGVLAYTVTERQREIGIRMALGASGRGVMSMVLGQGMALAGIGVVVGLVGALAVTRLASSLLFGVAPTDPVTIGGVAVFMTIVALVACVVPARRATRVEPVAALRGE
ncbi:MAG TPA: ABC transporter permease [Gemmatimonadaceae bacterium]|nr:ABC transporter permease [Gemmatimonadaceae bacterium]